MCGTAKSSILIRSVAFAAFGSAMPVGFVAASHGWNVRLWSGMSYCEPEGHVKKTFQKPVLNKREKLGAVTAAPSGSGASNPPPED